MNSRPKIFAAAMPFVAALSSLTAQQPGIVPTQDPPQAESKQPQGQAPSNSRAQQTPADNPVWAERLILTLKEASKTRQELTAAAQRDLGTVRGAAESLATLSEKDGKPSAQELESATAALAKVLDAIGRLKSQEPQFTSLYSGVLDSVRDALLKARRDTGGGSGPIDAAGRRGMEERLVLAAGFATDESVPERWRRTFEQIFSQLHQEAEAYGVGTETNALRSRIQQQTMRILESLQSRVYSNLMRDRLRFSRLGRQQKAYENVRLLLQTVGSFGGLEAEMQRLLEELPAEFLPEGGDGSTFDRWVEELLGRLEGQTGGPTSATPAIDQRAALEQYAERYRQRQTNQPQSNQQQSKAPDNQE